MPDPLDLVNAYVRRMRTWTANALKKGEPDVWSVNADAIQAVAEELQQRRAWAKPIPASYGDLSDLPPELLSQLSGAKTDPLEDHIFAIVKSAGTEVELDAILIELFRRHHEVHQRRFLTNKAYRMAQKGLIHIVPGRKGVYSIDPQSSAPEATPTSKPRESFSVDLDEEIPF